jgi:hypothetical protein
MAFTLIIVGLFLCTGISKDLEGNGVVSSALKSMADGQQSDEVRELEDKVDKLTRDAQKVSTTSDDQKV